jgi:hypothetical protein
MQTQDRRISKTDTTYYVRKKIGLSARLFWPRSELQKALDYKIPIGEAITGWVFVLRTYPELGLNEIKSYRSKLSRHRSSYYIEDEDGNAITWNDFEKLLMRREFPIPPSETVLTANKATKGANNLMIPSSLTLVGLAKLGVFSDDYKILIPAADAASGGVTYVYLTKGAESL